MDAKGVEGANVNDMLLLWVFHTRIFGQLFSLFHPKKSVAAFRDDDFRHTRYPTMADEEWRRLALERHEQCVLQGFEGTADERRRELERNIFTDEDVSNLRGVYEASRQQIESDTW